MRSTPPNADCDPLRLGILLSGRGSNFQAIAASIREGRLKGTEIAVVVSNVAEAEGIAIARDLGFETAVFVSKCCHRSCRQRRMGDSRAAIFETERLKTPSSPNVI